MCLLKILYLGVEQFHNLFVVENILNPLHILLAVIREVTELWQRVWIGDHPLLELNEVRNDETDIEVFVGTTDMSLCDEFGSTYNILLRYMRYT